MSVKLEAFLSLEASLSSRITAAWGKVSEDILPSVYLRLKGNDVLGATRMVDNLDLAPVIRHTRDYVRYVSLASMVYGASRLSGKAEDAKILQSKRLLSVAARTTASFANAIVNTVGDQVRAKLYTLIREYDLSQPSTNFAQSEGNVLFKAEDTTLLKPYVEFKNPVNNEAQRMIQMISALHTTRLAAFGFTEEASLLDVTEYAINEQLDNRICPVCEEMHGKTFQVSDARSLLLRSLSTDNPEELKTLQPWPSQSKASVEALREMSTRDIVDRGWHIPPYHPYCRGQLVRVGEVPDIRRTPSYQAAFPENVTGDFSPSEVDVETFKTLGIEATEEEVRTWVKEAGVHPAEVLSLITGLPPQEMADVAYNPVAGTASSDAYGLKMSLAVNRTEAERLRASVDYTGRKAGRLQTALDFVFTNYRKSMLIRALRARRGRWVDVLTEWLAAAALMGITEVDVAAGVDDEIAAFLREQGYDVTELVDPD